jgi:Leucine-rich repeat (LRR) protein
MKTKATLLTIVIILFTTVSGKSQTHPITIHPNQRVVSLQMTPSEYSSWITNDEFTSNDAKRQALVKDIYQKFDDKFDFIFLVLNEKEIPANFPYYGKLISTSNTITGIGLPKFNNSASYGSDGKLKALMALTGKDYLLYGPALHELMHNWGNFVIHTKDWNGSAEFDAIPHWGFKGGNTKGQLGGFKQSTLQTNIGGNANKYSVESFGGIANGGNSVPYTDLELYLMGMIPLTDVANFDVFSGLNQVTYVGSKVEFSASTRVTYDNAKILTEAGSPRIPSSETSQKNFRLLVVLLTPTPLTETEWTTLDDQSEKFGRSSSDGTTLYNFWEATRGLGSIETGNLLNAVRISETFPKPRNLKATAQNGQVLLNWNTPLITDQNLLGYNIYMGENSSPLNTSFITDTTYLTPIPGQEKVYTYKLIAKYQQGESDSITCKFENSVNPTILDSLALVALYNQCGGANWTSKTNWLSGPLNTWQDVTVENGRVVELNLGSNMGNRPSIGLVGTLPSEFSNLTELRILDLMENKLTGNLPESWAAMKNLKELYLQANQFSGTLPKSWSKLVNLEIIYLYNNNLTGELPENWSTLVNLVWLYLFNNQLTGSLPANWSSLVELQYLGLGSNKLSGTLPESWSTLVKLKDLYLDYNNFTGNLPESWSAMTNLGLAIIYGNKLTGTLPESWSALSNLENLSLDYNQFSGNLPESWSHLSKLEILGLGGNHLTGSLPKSWSGMKNIQGIFMTFNELSGDLPESWSALTKLEYLVLNNNQFTGPLPESWATLVNLVNFTIDNNKLEGPMPESWSNLVNLQYLFLENNQLSNLPNLSSLTKLSSLYIGSNRFDFGDIEPNIGIAKTGFSYAPQAPVGLADTIIKNQNEEFRISVKVGGKSNKYQWYKNGWDIISGETGSEFVISKVKAGDAGDYTCKITNTIATQLTLESQPITLQVIIGTNTGREEIELDGLEIYPNPTTGIVNIEFAGGTGRKTEISVSNLIGAEVFRKEFEVVEKFEVDLSNQASGIYLLKVMIDNRQYISKIVVSKKE